MLKHLLPNIEIYTDGSAKEGRGAWAYVLVKNGRSVREKSGGVRKAASNAMEFRAAIEALKSLETHQWSGLLNRKVKATLWSDSRILIDTMTVWQDTDLRPRGLEPEIAELDRLDQQHCITWRWLRAHAGHPFNERCDFLCIQARESL